MMVNVRACVVVGGQVGGIVDWHGSQLMGCVFDQLAFMSTIHQSLEGVYSLGSPVE